MNSWGNACFCSPLSKEKCAVACTRNYTPRPLAISHRTANLNRDTSN